ncbi:MAG: IS3 family transposase, partial [Proteobacteria bacterium]|nr:IS3 family transposase [Pseudomonadota bacterium]
MESLAGVVGVAQACSALSFPRSTFYRWRKAAEAPQQPDVSPTTRSPRRLSEPEEQKVLDLLHSERFVDAAPAQVWATLLDEGIYLCSERTMYRLLERSGENRERRAQLEHPPYEKPELLASGPNQVWSWDVTKLLGPKKWTYFYLFVVLDIF